MLDEYTDAFACYLRTGTAGALSDFCEEDADLVRLQVYRNGFLRACIEALRANYPSVERLAGEERFRTLARSYVEVRPPRIANLVEYGRDFPQFVEDARDVHRLDHLASFAALDRAWSEVWFAEDAPTPQTTALADVFGDAQALVNLRGRLAPWARLVPLDYCALQAWSRLRQGGPGERIEVRRTPRHVLIWRRGSGVLYRDLEGPEHVLIARIAAGQPCGEAAGAALEVDAGFDLVATFASLLHHRILAFGRLGAAG